MLEKLLLAVTVTFSLNVFISLSSYSISEQPLTTQPTDPVKLARNASDFLRLSDSEQ